MTIRKGEDGGGYVISEPFAEALRELNGVPPVVAEEIRCIPAEPEKDGWHWVQLYPGCRPVPRQWSAMAHREAERNMAALVEFGQAINPITGGWGKGAESENPYRQWTYLAPCPWPAGFERGGWAAAREPKPEGEP